MPNHFRRRAIRALAFVLVIPFYRSSVVGASAPSGPDVNGTTASKEQITILYDAFGRVQAMKKDWGFAALVENRRTTHPVRYGQ